MKWAGRRGSSNIDDRRGMSGGKLAIGGGIGAAVIYFLVSFVFGEDAATLLQQAQTPHPQEETRGVTGTGNASEDEMAKYASVVLADNEQVWTELFNTGGLKYDEPTMVLFDGYTRSGCGNASSASGPFYCPADERIYLDLSFFNELSSRFGAKGDFANAYVIAHEVGHHVQHQLGTSAKIREAMRGLDQTEANKLSVALELQADFYAGVWAHHNDRLNKVLERGDIEEALSAASAIGDDRLQKMSKGTVVPDAFTHGTSEQRMYWFKKGFDTGDPAAGNTFKEMGLFN